MKRCLLAAAALAGCQPDVQNLGYSGPPLVGAPRWAITVGGHGDDRAMAAAIDSIGDVVVVGDINATAEFGHTTIEPGGMYAGYVTKRVASDGSERWTVGIRDLDSTSDADAMGVAVAPDDSILVTGWYQGHVDFGGQALALPPDRGDGFIAKYSPGGQLLWVHGLAPTTGAGAHAIAVDAAGNSFVVGQGVPDQVQPAVPTDSDPDGYIVSFAPDGTLRWGTVLHADLGPYMEAVTVAPDGDVLVTGAFAGTATLGGAVLDAQAPTRGFVTHYRNDGLYLSSRVIGDAGPEKSEGEQIAVTPTGMEIVQTRDVVSTDSFFGVTHVHALDANDQDLWTASIDNTGLYGPPVRVVTTTPSGTIMSATFHEELSGPTLDVRAFTASGTSDPEELGNGIAFGPHMSVPFGAASGASGETVFAGTFDGTVDYGTGPVSTHGGEDAFIVLLDPP